MLSRSLSSPSSGRTKLHRSVWTSLSRHPLSKSSRNSAITAGYSVLFTSAPALVAQLAQAHEERLLGFTKPKILIVGELGFLPFEPDAAHLFFQLVSRRYERRAMPITSNRSVGVWAEVSADHVVATAIRDRLLHHSTVITTRGESFRLKEKRRAGLFQSAPVAKATSASPKTFGRGPER